MHLPRILVAAAALAARQGQVNIIPRNYCSPMCPGCYLEVLAFNETTSCVSNSTFITDCGACLSCVIGYTITNPGGQNDSSEIETFLLQEINYCANSPASSDVVALASQASRFSSYASILAPSTSTTVSPGSPTATGSAGVTTSASGFTTSVKWSSATSTPTWTHDTNNPCWTTILSTATWASAYLSKHPATVDGTAVDACSWSSQSTAAATTQPSSSQSDDSGPSATSIPEPLNTSWIVGPVLGSVLGIVTVWVVIYFTRRRQLRGAETMVAIDKVGSDAGESEAGDSVDGKAQLHSESVEPKELEVHEVYEMAAAEPVGQELVTPRPRGDLKVPGQEEEAWPLPLPLSPLGTLFKEVELRDMRTGGGESPRHDTFYHAG